MLTQNLKSVAIYRHILMILSQHRLKFTHDIQVKVCIVVHMCLQGRTRLKYPQLSITFDLSLSCQRPRMMAKFPTYTKNRRPSAKSFIDGAIF